MLGFSWTVDTFMACQTEFIVPTKGWTRKGLGLYRNFAGLWWLVHLNTGHGVVRLGVEDADGMAHESLLEVLPYADEIADATDWTFTHVGGWRNRDPDLPTKLQAIANRAAPGFMTSPPSANVRQRADKARGIALSRMDA